MTETYIVIDDATYPTNTIDEIEIASAAVRDAGLAYAEVYAGDPSGDEAVRNGQKLYAAA